jgi:hypothetical protein
MNKKGWVIVNEGPNTVQYFTFLGDNPIWVENSRQALAFASKEDAKVFVSGFMDEAEVSRIEQRVWVSSDE